MAEFYYVGTGVDDGCIVYDGSGFYNDAEIWIGTGPNHGFFRISDVTIPKNAIIDSAYINIYIYTYDGAGEYKYRVYAVAEDNPNTIANFADYGSRALTTAYVNWSPTFPGADWYWSDDYNIPDIKAVIQEVVNRSGWVSGNHLMLMVKDNSSAKSSYWDYYEDPGYALELEVVYHIESNIPVVNTTCEGKSPVVKYDIKINMPVVDTTCEGKSPVVKNKTIFQTIGGDYWQKNRYEKFEFELLSLNNGWYENNGWITNYVIRDSSNITMDFSRDVIGSANFHIKNNTTINYLSDLIRPWYVLNNTYRFPLGTYMLSSPNKKSDSKMVSRMIQGYDLLFALEQDKTIISVSYTASEVVTDIIFDLLDSIGWAKYDIMPSSEVLATDVSYELGRSKLFIINSLLNMINYYPLWADGNGVFRSIPWTNEANTCYEFIDDSLSIYTPNIELNLDYTGMYNRVIIICNQLTQDTPPLYKVWTFENEGLGSHPFSYTSLGRYITKIFQSEAVSQDYVDLRARRELLKMLEIEESIIYNHVFISSRENDGLPWQGDSYRFKNTKLDVDSIYKLQSLTYNLKTGGLVNSKIKRIRSTY